MDETGWTGLYSYQETQAIYIQFQYGSHTKVLVPQLAGSASAQPILYYSKHDSVGVHILHWRRWGSQATESTNLGFTTLVMLGII